MSLCGQKSMYVIQSYESWGGSVRPGRHESRKNTPIRERLNYIMNESKIRHIQCTVHCEEGASTHSSCSACDCLQA